MFFFNKEIKTGLTGKYEKKVRILGIPFDIEEGDGQKTKRRYFFGLFKKIKSDHERRYCIFGLPVLRTINDANRTEQRLLGISLHKLKKDNNCTKTYILGFRVRVKEGYASFINAQISALQDISSTISISNKFLLLNSCVVAHLHQKTFSEYKNKYQGKEMVLLASGPTNSKYCPIAHAIHVGVNRSFLKDDVKLDYLFVQDKRAFNDGYRDSIIQYRENDCKKFFGILSDRFSDWMIPESWSLQARAARYYTSIGLEESFAYDLSCQYVGDFGSVVFAALQFMLWCNPKRIYLVGCDCSNLPYAYDNSKVTDLVPSKLIGNYTKLKKFADVNYPDTEIISVNPVGLKGIFKDVYTNEYISEHTEFKGAEILKKGAKTGKKKALLVMAATGNYLFSVGNVLLGLKRHSPLMFDDIVVYTDQMASDEDKNTINKIFPTTFKIYDYQLPNLVDRKRLAYFSNMPYARFEMLTYLDRYEKVMWFDSDFLITGDISGLLNYGKTGIAMSIDLDPYPGGHGVGRFFVKDVPGYDMTAEAYASGLVIFSDHLANPHVLRKYLYRQLEKYSSHVRYAEQGILQLMIEDFSLKVEMFPKLTYHVFPWEDKRHARLFHLLGKYKPWLTYSGAYSDEWYENHEIWISLGGSEAFSFVPLIKKYAKVYSSTSFSDVLYLDIPHHDRRYQSILLADFVNKCLMT